MTLEIIFRANDNLLVATGLQNGSTLAFLNAATVTARLLDTADVEVPSSPITLAYQTGTDGIYHGTFQSTLALSALTRCTIELSANEAGVVGFWLQAARVTPRDFAA